MKKRILAMLTATMMVLGLAACGATDTKDGAGDTSAAGSSSSGDLIKVGIINNDPNESGYRTANDKDMKNMFTKENGYDASFAYSLKNDEQITAAQKFIQDGVDYLLLSAADTSGWDSVLKDAQDAGTQVILFDRVIDADESLYAASIVSDMDKEGQTACDWLKAQNLDEYNIIHIQGVMGSAAQKGRSGALTDTAAAEGWNIVNEQTAAGGGMMMLLILTSVLGYELKTAVGTSVFIMAFTAFTGAASHFVIGGKPDGLVFTLCVIFTLIWARIAAVFANKATPKTLNRVTGVILVILGIVVFLFSLWG